MNKFKRKCPDCKTEILYSTENQLNKSENNKSVCKKCAQKNRFSQSITNFPLKWILNCSNCGEIRTFSSYHSFKNAEYKESQLCSTCNGVINVRNNPETKQKISNSLKGKFSGEKNSFYGKKHSQETKDIIREKTDTKGEKNGMYGKSVYDIWTEKFGIEEADSRMNIMKSKQSIKSSGENNPMYGKPSPQGSGNGWSGWYKNWFFRSLRELSYMINEIEVKKLQWENGEQKKYRISYIDWDGKKRNYFPDFIIEGKYIIECKPEKLHNSPNVLLKKEAAEVFCDIHNLEYKLIDVEKINFEELQKLHKEKIIFFTEKYEKKFQNYIEK